MAKKINKGNIETGSQKNKSNLSADLYMMVLKDMFCAEVTSLASHNFGLEDIKVIVASLFHKDKPRSALYLSRLLNNDALRKKIETAEERRKFLETLNLSDNDIRNWNKIACIPEKEFDKLCEKHYIHARTKAPSTKSADDPKEKDSLNSISDTKRTIISVGTMAKIGRRCEEICKESHKKQFLKRLINAQNISEVEELAKEGPSKKLD